MPPKPGKDVAVMSRYPAPWKFVPSQARDSQWQVTQRMRNIKKGPADSNIAWFGKQLAEELRESFADSPDALYDKRGLGDKKIA